MNDIWGCVAFFLFVLLMVKPWEAFENWVVRKVEGSNWDHRGLR